jgi:hypothetical protein
VGNIDIFSTIIKKNSINGKLIHKIPFLDFKNLDHVHACGSNGVSSTHSTQGHYKMDFIKYTTVRLMDNT